MRECLSEKFSFKASKPDSKWDGVNLFNARETNTIIFLKTR